MQDLADRLSGGDRRSIGAADAVAADVVQAPDRFTELWALVSHGDPLVRMRAADAAEKVTRGHPCLLLPWRDALLDGRLDDGTAEVRWHLLAMSERLLAQGRVDDARSRIRAVLDRHEYPPVRRRSASLATALQAAADLAARTPGLGERFAALLAAAAASDAPSLRARARRIARESPISGRT